MSKLVIVTRAVHIQIKALISYCYEIVLLLAINQEILG